jgi:hypothetical protein
VERAAVSIQGRCWIGYSVTAHQEGLGAFRHGTQRQVSSMAEERMRVLAFPLRVPRMISKCPGEKLRGTRVSRCCPQGRSFSTLPALSRTCWGWLVRWPKRSGTRCGLWQKSLSHTIIDRWTCMHTKHTRIFLALMHQSSDSARGAF